MTQDKVDGHEAYRDDPAYTAPEMEPYRSEHAVVGATDIAVISAAGLSLGAGGGAIAGQVLADEIDTEIHETTFNPEPERP